MKTIVKLLFSLFLFLLTIQSTFAQDQIVTIKNDTFQCEITNIDGQFIYFNYKAGKEIRSTIIPIDKVKSYNKKNKSNQNFNKADITDSQLNPSINSNESLETEKEYTGDSDKKSIATSIRINLGGGYSHFTAQSASGLSPDLKAYEDELRSGQHFLANISAFPNNRPTGFGLRFSNTQTSHSAQFSILDPDIQPDPFLIDVADDISITCIGPYVCSRYSIDNTESIYFVGGFAISYVSYVNNARFGNNLNLRGEGFGMSADLGLDIKLYKGFFLNLTAGYLINSLSQVSVNGTVVQFNNNEGLDNSHLNLRGGLTIYLQ